MRIRVVDAVAMVRHRVVAAQRRVRCIASRRALASPWEVRIVRRSDVLRRDVFRCFIGAARAADAWRVEFGGCRV